MMSVPQNFSASTTGAVAAASAGALFIALVAQFGFGLQPCELCLLQRLPFVGTLFLSVMALLPAVPPMARRQVIGLCATLFAINAVLAGYHTGVEYHWWQGPTACTGRVGDFNLDDLQAALGRPSFVSCDQPAIRILGISMAGANAILCAVLAAASAWATAQKEKWAEP